MSIPHGDAIQMIQFVLETSGFQGYQCIFGNCTGGILISHSNPVRSSNCTLISEKTQAALVIIGKHRAGFCNFWVEAQSGPAADSHNEYPAAVSDLCGRQSDAIIILHKD